MILILILVTSFLQIIDVSAKKFRIIADDDLYPYTLENDVAGYKDYFSDEHVILEVIGDDQVRVGGYGVCTKSMDPNILMSGSLKTQLEENGIWKDGPVRINGPDVCAEFLNPVRPWYNITKLWTNCPPQEGDKWFVEEQIINAEVDVPPSFGKGRWRGYILFFQDVVKVTTKMGVMVQVELVEVV